MHEQLLTSETSAVLPHTLHGMGDVGKSQTAIEYVYQHTAPWQTVTGMAMDEYLGLIREKIAELKLELVPSPDYPMSVADAWDVSLRQLEQRNPAALQLLQVCSFFAPEPM
ncbi:hypothetical protein [Streptomyces sasae]|uniref:hypothetical protein n=1 Tax=Streptomyces sasae TaxID=1266772 RepID=UPI00292F10D3|nr:hypothetical protein [Streptomyces sasae]